MSSEPKKPTRGKFVLRNGKWEEGKASPELLPEHMRALPDDLVTKDEADEKRIHAEDPGHIVQALVYENAKAEKAAEQDPVGLEKLKALARIPVGDKAPLTQMRIDVEKMHANVSILSSMMAAENPDLDKVWHIWFPTDNVNDYELREGPPPPDIERPKHLRNFNLVVDPLVMPASVIDRFKEAGIPLSDGRTALEQTREQVAHALESELVQKFITDVHG